MFAFILRVAQSTWSKATTFGTLAIDCITDVARRTARILAPVLSCVSMIAVTVLSGLAMAQAAQEAEVQAAKARVLADRLLTGDVAVEDIDASVAAYRTYRVHAAAYPCVGDLPSTAELRRLARARSLVRILLV